MALRTLALASSLNLATLASSSESASFSAAEVKPHYQCSTADGQDHVRNHINGLVGQETGIISLIQFEFTLAQPTGYTSFGASCTTGHADPVVVLVNEKQFSIVSGIGETTVGDYASLPFLSTGKAPPSGSMCVADPSVYGQRGYAAAVLKHTSSGTEFCAISGTFPHCRGSWQQSFIDSIKQSCTGRPVLVIADTNAACETEGPQASKGESMQAISDHHNAGWGACSDPAIENPAPTCCHDLSQGHPEARYWYDRTAICGGGVVDSFQVNDNFVCGTNEEHKYTTAIVHLSGSSDEALVVV